MIAIGLSGGADSAAAAFLLHDFDEKVCGISASFGISNPGPQQLERAAYICRYLGIDHHVLDVSHEFESIKRYFCNEYLRGNTPNPCVICNRDIKFNLLRNSAKRFGADIIATGHYVKKGFEQGRYFVSRSCEKNSQEYFLGLLDQKALKQSIFPLESTTKNEAHRIIVRSGLKIPRNETSQDVCFIDQNGYVDFIRTYIGYQPKPGPVLDCKGRIIGKHRGALYYTLGQRKGLGMGFGKKVYVLGIDMAGNTITVGDLNEWPHSGFIVRSVNYMKIPGIYERMEALVKVRYRQRPEKTMIVPGSKGELMVHYRGLFSPGQLAVVYDHEGAILCAGIIDAPLSRSY
jgi:tRNA-specific 2-thiouridylase